jgi:hypothetical protein
VRHVSRLFVTAAHLRVPFFSVVLRKGYGLGAMGMAAGGFHAPVFTVAWPTGEFGAMGLEGAVRWATARSSKPCPKARSARRCTRSWWRKQYANGSAPCPACCPTSIPTACSNTRWSTPTARSTTCRKSFQGVMRDISGHPQGGLPRPHAVLVPGSGTFGMEAVARQFATGKKVLVIRNGWFSYRWTQIFDMGRIPARPSC